VVNHKSIYYDMTANVYVTQGHHYCFVHNYLHIVLVVMFFTMFKFVVLKCNQMHHRGYDNRISGTKDHKIHTRDQ